MLSMGYTICMIVVCAFCTFAERLLPFLIFRKGSVPNLVRYLGNILPVAVMRSEERRVGKECLRLCRSRWSPYH